VYTPQQFVQAACVLPHGKMKSSADPKSKNLFMVQLLYLNFILIFTFIEVMDMLIR
jgi:hypothetical protein